MKKIKIFMTFVVIVTVLIVSIVSVDGNVNELGEAICIEKFTGDIKMVSDFTTTKNKINHYSLYIPAKMSRVINEKYPKDYHRTIDDIADNDLSEDSVEIEL